MTVDQTELTQCEIAAVAKRIDRPIVLVGLMGTGKSSVGRKLASELGLPFVDADDAIEEAAQLSINEIFDQYGEEEFRDGERRVIARLMDDEAGVIATGGGAFCNEETRALILAKGIAVWLNADVDTLVERVSRKTNRPLLRNADPREVLSRQLAERAPAYAEAPIHVLSETGPHRNTVLKIIKAIDEWL